MICVGRDAPWYHKAKGPIISLVAFEHPIAHADLREDILRRGGILLDLTADVRHVHAQDLVVRLAL